MNIVIGKKHYHHKREEDLSCFSAFNNSRSGSTGSVTDEKQVFTAIQIERYLKRKTLKRFCSEAEKDVILDIISDYWKHINEEIDKASDLSSKIDSFYHCIIVYPYFVAEEERVIPVDFQRKSVISWEEECSCGSRIPYYQCCGRTGNPEDGDNGSF